jgi:hypothetical protein
MRVTIPWLAAVLCLGVGTGLAAAQYPYPYPYPYPVPMVRQAPNTFGPGYYATNQYGGVYGPNYCLQPPFLPFNGVRPNLQRQQQQGPPAFPTHPFARSPRDFFMLEQ